jgi:hypothetical protein
MAKGGNGPGLIDASARGNLLARKTSITEDDRLARDRTFRRNAADKSFDDWSDSDDEANMHQWKPAFSDLRPLNLLHSFNETSGKPHERKMKWIAKAIQVKKISKAIRSQRTKSIPKRGNKEGVASFRTHGNSKRQHKSKPTAESKGNISNEARARRVSLEFPLGHLRPTSKMLRIQMLKNKSKSACPCPSDSSWSNDRENFSVAENSAVDDEDNQGVLIPFDDNSKAEQENSNSLVAGASTRTLSLENDHGGLKSGARPMAGGRSRFVLRKRHIRISDWIPVLALFFLACGVYRKEVVVDNYKVTTMVQYKKGTLPPPVRLIKTNPKSFHLNSATF